MALIPPDAGIRMRMQTEASLHPVLPVAGVPSDLPDLQPGQVFSARIQEVLPEATYKALVAGKQLTLALPDGAKAGDTLELLVVDRSEHVITARLAQPASANVQAYAHTTLSPAAQLIGGLLASEGEPPQPAPLNRGQPLLPQAPMQGQALAPALEKAVTNSGLFYEAHQAQWVAGRLPVTQLLQEPQGRHSNPAAVHTSDTGIVAPPTHLPVESDRPRPPATTTETVDATSARNNPSSASIPEDLRPLVQQQLDAVATQRLAWHGEVWPGQVMEWEIERDKPQTSPSGEESPEQWATSLRLTTPRLGSVHATIRLTAAGVGMIIATPHGASAADLRDELPALATSLEAAGVPPLLLQVQHEAENRGE
ncbi:MAG: flagellar hook-length control protein FliK [Rhodocyclaceae bacterium]|nr:flagellar hook-length control protein FliK [Rhodocyclaceae bacterium]